MRIPASLQFFAFGLLTLILVNITSAFAAGIDVPPSNIGHQSIHVTANGLKPPACAALYLTNIVSGSGTLTGTAGNDLILGSAGVDIIDGLGGDDCILAGSGDDLITGNDGIDICIGSLGTDTFTTCEGENQ
jgi:hypothetical protein